MVPDIDSIIDQILVELEKATIRLGRANGLEEQKTASEIVRNLSEAVGFLLPPPQGYYDYVPESWERH
jgi:hypothetical protein